MLDCTQPIKIEDLVIEVNGKLNKSGDTMTGQLNVEENIHCDNLYSRNEITARSIISTGINANSNSAIQFNYMNGLNGVLFYDNAETTLENKFKLDLTTAEEGYVIWHEGNFTPADKSDVGHTHTRNEITDLDTYQKSEHISISNGIPDAGKPIVLNSSGVIDSSMLDVSVFYYVGPFNPEACADPTTGCEYPDTTGETHGAFWAIQGMSGDYTFVEGELAGQTVSNGDFMVWAASGWSIMAGEMNPLLYYKLDGSNPLQGNMDVNQYLLKNLGDAVDSQDAVNLRMLDTKASKSGDTFSGDIILKYNDTVSNMPVLEWTRLDDTTVSRIYGAGISNSMVFETSLGDGNILNQLVMSENGELLLNNHKIWHEGNDGGGSGLNADLLSGKSLDEFVLVDGSVPMLGDLTIGDGNTGGNLNLVSTMDASGSVEPKLTFKRKDSGNVAILNTENAEDFVISLFDPDSGSPDTPISSTTFKRNGEVILSEKLTAPSLSITGNSEL
jgi:hypothetical protein